MGQLGDGTTTKRLRPVTVAGLATVVDIVGGRDMSYAWLADGTVRSWGGGANGELGNGPLTARQTRPVTVTACPAWWPSPPGATTASRSGPTAR